MNRRICTEIAEFEVKTGVTDDDLMKTVEELERNFHSKQEGFIDSELVKGNRSCQWLIIQHWQSAEKAKEASKKMMEATITEEFRESLNPRTVKIRYFNKVSHWSH